MAQNGSLFLSLLCEWLSRLLPVCAVLALVLLCHARARLHPLPLLAGAAARLAYGLLAIAAAQPLALLRLRTVEMMGAPSLPLLSGLLAGFAQCLFLCAAFWLYLRHARFLRTKLPQLPPPAPPVAARLFVLGFHAPLFLWHALSACLRALLLFRLALYGKRWALDVVIHFQRLVSSAESPFRALLPGLEALALFALSLVALKCFARARAAPFPAAARASRRHQKG